jgi:hypothetical protein
MIGVVFFGLLSGGADSQAQKVVPQLRADLAAASIPAEAQDPIVKGFITCFHDRSTQKDASLTPDSCKLNAAAAQMPPATLDAVGNAMEKAGKAANAKNFANGFVWSVGYELVLMLLVFGLVFLLPRKIQPEHMQEA